MEFAESIGEATTRADFTAEALVWLPHVARYARLLTRDQSDADDLAQETFLRAFENWHTFRPGTDCRKWLFTICRNLFLRERQRARRVIPFDDPEVELRETVDLYLDIVKRGFDGLFDRIDLRPALDRELRRMAPEYREVVLLVDVEDQTYASAASALSIPVGTVRSRLFRGRRLLQQALAIHARDMGIGNTAAATPPEEEK